MIDLNKVLSYSKDCLPNRAQMKSIILDLYPGVTREMNVLLDVYESGIPREIKNAGRITDSQYAAYIQRIIDEYGFQEQNAIEGLNAWIDVCIAPGTADRLKKPSSLANNPANITSGIHQEPVIPKPVNDSFDDDVFYDDDTYEIKDVDEQNAIEIVGLDIFARIDDKILIVPNTIQGRKVIGIGKYAFKDCTRIEKIVISEGIKYIDDGAFQNCSAIKEVVLPSTMERIGSVEKESYAYDRRDVSKLGVFAGTSIKTIKLPDGLLFLGSGTFNNCRFLESIVIPDNVTYIKKGTFSDCEALKQVIFSDDLKIIEADAFSGCKALTNVVLPPKVQKIENGAFKGCKALADVQLNEGLEEIGSMAFFNCKLINKIFLPSTLKVIGEKVFDIFGFGTISSGKNPKLTIFCYAGSKGLEYAHRERYPVEDASKK